jgi:hypothetical protein
MSGLNGVSVTDNKRPTGDAFDNRNGGVSRTLDDVAAEIGALFDAACPYTDEEKRLLRLIRESAKRAAFCGKCERAIGPSDPVYRPRLTTRGFFLGHGSCRRLS